MTKKIFLILLTLSLFACQDNAKKSRTLLNKGILMHYKGKNQEALKFIDQAIETKPDFAEAYLNRADIYISQNDTALALKDLNKAIEYNNSFGEAFKKRALLKSMLNDADGACQDYKKASELGIPNLYNYTSHCR